MAGSDFRPVVYLKDGCPFCLKVRLFLLEAGIGETVETRAFVPGAPEEQTFRDELASKLTKLSFPTAEMKPGWFIADSDVIIDELAKGAGINPAELPVYNAFLTAAFQPMMELFRENMALKTSVA